MPLSWNEIRSRAHEFSRRWAGEESERAEAQSFWNDFFNVFGIQRRRVAVFEKQVQLTRAGEKLKHGRIDAFWKGMLLIEHKSRGQDLNRAFAQAADYFDSLPDRDLPRYILVSDFERFRLSDLEEGAEVEFHLADLHKQIKYFAFVAGYQTQVIQPQNPVNIKAAERMGRLHDRLKASGYTGHPLEVLLVRLLFCLFAEDTGIFQPAGSFRAWLDERTAQDGADLGAQLAQFFQVLNTPEDKRSKNLDEQLAVFPYVNGKLFEETLSIAAFNADMREALLDCCALDWSAISPAIFGALFQSIMDDEARRNLGAHYTSEENILKLIKPLFLDSLREEFQRARNNKNKLFEFHKKLRTLTFFDPACGCGNFLVIAYRELRLLELDLLRAVHAGPGSRFLDIHQEIQLDVDQFYGIEIEEFPAQIAQVALWLMDHQMNVRVSEEFGMYFARIPLKSTPHIHHANALTTEWVAVLSLNRASYVFGNPPFVGKKEQSVAQKKDVAPLFSSIMGSGVLDYVTAWYIKAAAYIQGTHIRCAFVSTNSITQGEQVGVLWGFLLARGVHIHFAHRTFQWSNEARGMAAVHCVIIGFGAFDAEKKTIYEYADIRGEPHAIKVANINPYLVDAPDVVLEKRSRPICPVPEMNYGSMALDDGHLLMTTEQKDALLGESPEASTLIRRFMGGDEFLNKGERWCLWLKDAQPSQLKNIPGVRDRIEQVRAYRASSGRATTVKLAAFPSLFGENRQPANPYLLLPKVSSENRLYMPVGYCGPEIIASGSSLIIPDATPYHLGVLQSAMHMAWMRCTCGRMKSDYQYSVSIVYNNFPWPENPNNSQRQKIEEAAQALLNARAQFPDASLADLYDPLTMPPVLVKAHQTLDAAVNAAYGRKSFKNDAERVSFLFNLYQKYTTLLLETTNSTSHGKSSQNPTKRKRV